jgi:hypothetical protein
VRYLGGTYGTWRTLTRLTRSEASYERQKSLNTVNTDSGKGRVVRIGTLGERWRGASMEDRTTRKSWMQQKMQQVGRRERVLEFVSTGCALAGRNGSA